MVLQVLDAPKHFKQIQDWRTTSSRSQLLPKEGDTGDHESSS